jgi:UDP-hydrolysing UDP-N-acetyl-D-glucosamine 2-epimerase
MKIAVFTSGRQDWGILAPVCRAIAASPALGLRLIAGGMHLRDGVPATLDDLAIDAIVPARSVGDDDAAVAVGAGETVIAVAAALDLVAAESLLVVGDRTETLAAAVAATCLRLPIVHLHGGEETAGAIDNACRHAITKLSHLHFVAHPAYAERVMAMGERPDRVFVCGAPALDQLLSLTLLDEAALAKDLGRPGLGHPLVVLTHHPTTLGIVAPADEIAAVLAGLDAALADRLQALVVATRANDDSGGGAINAILAKRAASKPARFLLAGDLGARRYYSLLERADLMVGNSSSGILEAPSFSLPVVNVGDRQRGRLRLGQIADVPPVAEAIAAAIVAALGKTRRPSPPAPSGFGDGHAAERIRARLEAFAGETPAQRLDKSVTGGNQ